MPKTIAIRLRPGSNWDRNKSVREQAYWDEHARFVDELFEAGKVVMAGPFADGSGSMVILAAESPEAARDIFSEDPWAHQDILVIDHIKEWTIFLDVLNRTRQ